MSTPEINKVIGKHPKYDTVHVITDSDLQHLATTTSRFQTSSLYNILLSPTPNYIHAVPFDTNPEVGDSLSYTYVTDELTLVLTKDLFTRIPNMKSKHGTSRVRQSKVTCDGSDRVRLVLKQARSLPELKFIIDKLFSDVDVTVYYDVVVEGSRGVFSMEKNVTKIPVGLASVARENEDDRNEFYELVTLCCCFDDVIHDNDAFTSLSIGELETRTRYTLKNVTSSKLKDLDWLILSLHNGDNHLLLYRPDPATIDVYET
ncbi:hypothetical protein Cantr_02197 [Candida viswanathii]|uniref:Uncharacterized protein n=1 Tax=Candida viswanathii TaxID=5486 RepID=A0A367YKS5_9ASCO|nr:hypothetical protein Cantr_02197 [Candida viswanathii]